MASKFPSRIDLFLESLSEVPYLKIADLPEICVDLEEIAQFPEEEDSTALKQQKDENFDYNFIPDGESTKNSLKRYKSSSLAYDDFWSHHAPLASITEHEIITSPSAQKTKFFISFHCKEFKLEPGDSFCIFPQNSLSDIQRIQSNFPCNVQITYNGVCLNLYDFILYKSDIKSIPKRSHIRFFAENALDSICKRYLYFLCSPEGSAEYNRLRIENCSFLDYLQFFKLNCSLLEIARIIPLIKGRFYSIANSQHLNSERVDFCFSRIPFGLCTEWLSKLKVGDKIAVSVKTDNGNPKIQPFRLPADFHAKPLIMIGPGTGIAPFIGFLHHFQMLSQKPTECWLFFGCRSELDDFIFRKELNSYHQNGILDRFNVVFSSLSNLNTSSTSCTETVSSVNGSQKIQDNVNISLKRYVQDSILENKNELADLIMNREAYIYVCGDGSQMGKDVMKSIESILPIENAKAYISEMIKSKRYRQDIW